MAQTAVLLVVLLAATAAVQGMQNQVYYTSSRVLTGGGNCDSHTCGLNARCILVDGRPVCSCLNLHMGDPLVRCDRVECSINEDCLSSRVCRNNQCVDPCQNACGNNAQCDVNNHVPVCSCPKNYKGNPLVQCIFDPQAACDPNPCGINTNCNVINGIATCSCQPGFRGRPLEGCRHECEYDGDCAPHQYCSAAFKCENPCATKCGANAECNVVNHRANCQCPKNYIGNPLTSCQPECQHHSDCPLGKPACIYLKCVNPCTDPSPCGINANCELRDNLVPVCSCPKDRTGDPFKYCRPFTDDDLCEPNPCGINAECRPGHDNTGKKRPVCTCPHGYIGNALVNCIRGECTQDSECPHNRACINFSCQNPCTGRECGMNASCSPRKHIAVCTCNEGYRGDALYSCNFIQEGRQATSLGRYIRY